MDTERIASFINKREREKRETETETWNGFFERENIKITLKNNAKLNQMKYLLRMI